MISKTNNRVAIAMSGGVDSSVAAAMLLEQGYDVVGVTMCLLRGSIDRSTGACCSPESVEDARRVAAKIGITHVVIPMQDAFEKFVIDDFIEEYRQGHTPNPCVRCNRYLKFDLLIDWAKSVGADKIATGHYSRIRYDQNRDRWLLLRGDDRRKDQSYALYSLSQDQLAHTLFPLGEITKKETRERAEALGLAVADKPDSQEICFVPDRKYPEFLEKVAPDLIQPGPLVDTSGKVWGEHRGIAFFTVGQRKRLGISAGKPMYVIRVDKDTNTVVIGDDSELLLTRVLAKNFNLISQKSLPAELAVTGKIRYNTKDSKAVVRKLFNDTVEVVFEQPQRAITPGQAIVLYQDDEVLGGGTILDESESAKVQSIK